MLRTAVDLEEMVAVILVAPPFAEAEWPEYCAAIQKLAEQTQAGTRPVLLQHRGSSAPPAARAATRAD